MENLKEGKSIAVCAHQLKVWHLEGEGFRQIAQPGWLRCEQPPGHPRDIGHKAAGRAW